MPTDPRVVHELRTQFVDGATPSMLIRYIVSCHRNDPNWHHLVQQYFREAFQVPIVRILNDPNAWDQTDLSHWDLNIHLLHRMVENRSTWLQVALTAGRESWLDSLVAHDEPDLIRQSQPPAELAESWAELPPQVQEYVQRLTGNARALHERVLLLARLAERLQQRLAECQTHAMKDAAPPT